MEKNLGSGVSFDYDAEGYGFDKVVFQKGLPPLDGELNLSQELQEILTRRSTSAFASGWVSFRDYFTSAEPELQNAFYTQDPDGAIPEVAFVNGWPIVVSGTNTDLGNVNKVLLTEFPLLNGSRVDGVFLEVWRSLISPTTGSKPVPQSIVNDINGVYMHSPTTGWAVGNNGVILHTDNGGITWKSQNSTTGFNLKKVVFITDSIGYAIGEHGVILKTNTKGSLWRQISVNVVDDLNDITAFNSNTVWVSGNNGTVLKTNDGEHFDVALNTQQVTHDLRGIFFFDSLVGWSVGENGVLIKTNDGGISWVIVPIPGITGKINSVHFVNLNDGLAVGDNGLVLRTTDGGNTWADISQSVFNELEQQYETVPNNLNRVFSVREFPIKISLKLYDASTFKSGQYIITPSTLTLKWVIRSTLLEVTHDLILAEYADAEALTDAINDIIDDTTTVRVFEATLDFLSGSFSSHPSNGGFVDNGSTEIKFSIEDRAWIVGDGGLLLMTTNSGAQWIKRDTGTVSNLKDIYYLDETTGWTVGSEGSILFDAGASFEEQDTDLSVKIISRIYPEGNVHALSSEFLVDNIIHPDVKVETSKRVQLQYRIRVVEGVDPNVYPESGLGSAYVFSRGPNGNVIDAGSYAFRNMGSETGDYGLWKANCRNTVDGFCWAVPMFFVTRRNLAPFNSQNNINGSVNFELGAIRPDAQAYTTIGTEDVVDTRRAVVVNSYKHLLEKNFDKLLNNTLRTKIGRRSEKGTQFGTALLAADRYLGEDALNDLAAGNINSRAVFRIETLGGADGLDASIGIPSQADLTFPVKSEGLYHGNPAHYSAVYDGLDDLEGQPIPGTFEGLGTSQVKFVLGSDAVSGSDFPDLRYKISAGWIDYSAKGLARIPSIPIAVRNFNTADPAASLYYRAVDKNAKGRVIQTFDSAIEGVKDFVSIAPTPSEDAGSMIEYHYFKLVVDASSTLRIPKEINNFVVYGVRSVINPNGSLHRIDRVEDREFINFTSNTSNLVIHINEAFRVPADTIVEVVLDVVSVPTTIMLGRPDASRLGLSGSDSGETLDAFRNSFVAGFDSSIKGVESFYKAILLPVSDFSTPSEITLSGPSGSSIVGIASFTNLDGSKTPYCWYSPMEEVNDIDSNINSTFSFHTEIIQEVEGLGTDSVVIKIDQALSPNALVYVPVIIEEAVLDNSGDTSGAEVFYKHRAFQTVENLPGSLTLDIKCMSEYIYISNLGTGGGELGDPYRNPLNHIPVNMGTFFTESMFFNLDPLRFSNFEITSGYLKLPIVVGRQPGDEVTLSTPLSDKLGRSFYSVMSEELRYVCDGLKTLSPIERGSPRKVFIPALAKVKSSITSPFVRGELVLIILSRVMREEVTHETGIFPGSETAIGIYRLTNKPLVRN